MKKFFLLVLLTTSTMFAIHAQSGDSLVTNLQLKAGTIRTIAPVAQKMNIDYSLKAFTKWYANLKASNPSNNANVTIDSIPTLMIATLYEIVLFDVKYANVLQDIETAVNSKRNSNELLDALCTEAESRLAAYKEEPLIAGTKLTSN